VALVFTFEVSYLGAFQVGVLAYLDAYEDASVKNGRDLDHCIDALHPQPFAAIIIA